MGFFIAIFFGAIAWHLAINDKEIAGSIIGTVDLIGLVTIFIKSRNK